MDNNSYNFYELVRKIKDLNMAAEIRVDKKGTLGYNPDVQKHIYSSIPVDKLVLPEGYYYDEKYGITSASDSGFFMYITVGVKDIADADPNTTHDILEVDLDGLTKEEKEKLELNKDEEKEEVEEEKMSLKDKVTKTINGLGDKFVMTKLGGKFAGLYDRVVNKFKYVTSKRKKVDLNEAPEVKAEATPEQQVETMKRILSKMENDDYIMSKLKNDMKDESLLNIYKTNRAEFIEILRDYELVGELHKFAVKDKNYDEKTFESLAQNAVNLRTVAPARINKLLQVIRYGNINEDQMKVISDALFEIEKVAGPAVNKKKKKHSYGSFSGGSTSSSTPSVQAPSTVNTPAPVNKTPETVTITEADKRKAECVKEFNAKKSELYNKLGDYEKAFIDDSAAEWVEPGDNEFDMMINERAVDKKAILDYLNAVEDLKIKMAFDVLDDYEKMFVEDAKAETIEPGDNEFDMMLGERTVNKGRILNYYRDIAEAQKKQAKIKETSNKYFGNKEEAPKIELDEHEKMFVEDAKAETLEPGDNEFDQMANERTIDKDKVVRSIEDDEILKEMRERYKRIEDLSVMSSSSDEMQSGGRSR